MKLSTALREVMHKSGLSQYRLTKLSGLDVATVSRIVRGQSESPGWLNVERLINAIAQHGIGWKGYLLAVLSEPEETGEVNEVAIVNAEDLVDAVSSELKKQEETLAFHVDEMLYFDILTKTAFYLMKKPGTIEDLVNQIEALINRKFRVGDIMPDGINQQQYERFKALLNRVIAQINSTTTNTGES
jgi:transcriptional regulator with XRE-family HTH domain